MNLGKFQIIEEIGHGGFGTVYRANDITLDRIVALKILHQQFLSDQKFIESFKREARMMAKVSHPNVVQIFEVGDLDGQIYIAMQYFNGGNLDQKIQAGGPLPLKDAIRMLNQTARGLEAGHKIGLVHRDVKPANILYNRDEYIAISDFGVAKSIKQSLPETTNSFNQFAGTPYYIPPELWKSEGNPSPSADVYSLACVFYEALTGEVLFAGETYEHVLTRHVLDAPTFSPAFPESLTDTLAIALSKNPSDRYQTIHDFLAAVRGALEKQPLRSTRTTTPLEPTNVIEELPKPLAPGEITFDELVRRSQRKTNAQSPVTKPATVSQPTPLPKRPPIPTEQPKIHKPEPPVVIPIIPSPRKSELPPEQIDEKESDTEISQPEPEVNPPELAVKQSEETPFEREEFTPDEEIAAVAAKTPLVEAESGEHSQAKIPVEESVLAAAISTQAALTESKTEDALVVEPGSEMPQEAQNVAPTEDRLTQTLKEREDLLAHNVATSKFDQSQKTESESDAKKKNKFIPLLAFGGVVLIALAVLVFSGQSRNLFERVFFQRATALAIVPTRASTITETPVVAETTVVEEPTEAPISLLGSTVISSSNAEQVEQLMQLGKDSVISIAYSPDGKTLAAGGIDKTIILWDVENGSQLRTLEGHSGTIWSVAWSPDGKTLASGNGDHTIILWDVGSGKQQHTLKGDTDGVMSVAWSPDGKTVASGNHNGTIILWDAASGSQLNILIGHTSYVLSVAWSPDGKTLASGSSDNTIILWDAGNSSQLRTLEGHKYMVNSVAWSPDGKMLASGSNDDTIKLWDVDTGKQLRTLKANGQLVWSVAWSPDGKTLASGSYRTIMLWDAGNGSLLRTLRGHTSHVRSVAWAPNGNKLASGGDDKTIRFWGSTSLPTVTLTPTQVGKTGSTVINASNADQVEQLHTWKGQSLGVASIAWSPNGKTLASGSYGNTIILWDAGSGSQMSLLGGHTEGVTSVAWSPDGKTIASGSEDNTIILWNVGDGNQHRTLKGFTSDVNSVAWSPDGKTLASGSNDGNVRLWDAENGVNLLTLEGHASYVLSIAWSPDGKRLASGSYDESIKLWDVDAGIELRTLKGHSLRVTSVAWSPDGKTLASGSYDGDIRLWDAKTGTKLYTLKGHTSFVTIVTWSPDGKTLASGSADGNVHLWDAESGNQLSILKGHSYWVTSVAWSPDGKTVASVKADGTIILWGIP